MFAKKINLPPVILQTRVSTVFFMLFALTLILWGCGESARDSGGSASTEEFGSLQAIVDNGSANIACAEGAECDTKPHIADPELRSGKKIFNISCISCHVSGAASAPRSRVAKDWHEPLAKGLDVLYANAINGVNDMPARGLCGSCSDEEIKAAVDYMLDR